MSTDISRFRVAVIRWNEHDGIADAVADELSLLGHEPVFFLHDQPLPQDVDVIFSFAPYGRLMQIADQLGKMPKGKRPFFLHWNMENGPNPDLPWGVAAPIASFRSWVDRLNDQDTAWAKMLRQSPPLRWVDERMIRFRLIGEYHYAHRQGLLDMLFESSHVYVQQRQKHGLPAIFVPWGTVPGWHETLGLARDIDVLWMGKRRTKRRSVLLDQVQSTLEAKGYSVYMADNEVKPFLYGEERTEMLNRAKITLNIESASYDNALPYRFHVVAPNRSLVVSETLLPHYPAKPGEHYVASPYDKMVETLLHYLEQDAERLRIVEAAYALTTAELTFGNAIAQIMAHVSAAMPVQKTAVLS